MREDKELYKEFLKSEEWQATRKEVWRRAKGCCECCGDSVANGETHHITYGGINQEGSIWPSGWLCRTDFLKYLCPICHGQIHNKRHPLRVDSLRAEMIRVFGSIHC